VIATDFTSTQLAAAGRALCEAGDPVLGADYLRAAAAQDPDPQHLTCLAGALRGSGQLRDAEDAAWRAVRLDPTTRRIVGLADIIRDQGRTRESEDMLRSALEADPGSADAAGFLGTWLIDRWRDEDGSDDDLVEADQLLALATAGAPQNLSFQGARLIVLQTMERYREWNEASADLLARYPNQYRFQIHRGFALLKTGRLAEGMRVVAQAVPRRPDIADSPLLQHPVWHPGDPPGRVVVWNTDGAGDGFHLARYLSHAAADGAQVELIANEPETRLMSRIAGISAILNPAEVELGRYATLFSIAADYLARGIMPTEPYVTPYPKDVAHWRHRFEGFPGLKVGLCWRGNPKQDNDRRRSFQAAAFEPLFNLPGVTLFSLQKGHRDELAGTPILDLGEIYQAGDWADTAAAISCLDLVISACTGVAHVAGAMGKPVWLALSEPGCWRWGIGREDSPWYPTMRIFRQARRGSWDGVFERMMAQLRFWTWA
jgi:tetratricopeptide (TPR) repeat protein